MRLIRVSVIALIVSAIPMFSCAEGLRVNINYLVFHLPDDTSYVEMQFLFSGKGLIYKQTEAGQYQAITKVKVQFANEETEQVIDRQYSFFSEAYEDTSAAVSNNMYNLVRIPLPQGSYQLQIAVSDANDSLTAPLTHQDVLKIDFDREKVQLSDIQAVSSLTSAMEETIFSKYGYDYVPYFSTFYPENITDLTYFAEIYNLDKQHSEKEFYAVSYIAEQGTNSPISADFQKEKKLRNSSQYLLIQGFAIDSLPSGNYNLVIDIKDEQGLLYAHASLFFQRSNPSVVFAHAVQMDSLPFDTLKLYLEYIQPIANKEEQYFISRIMPEDYETIGDFFQDFWYKRNPDNPQEAWFKYYKRVMQVNNNYTTLRFKGYKTDRGHYYLRYGPPNYIEYYTSDVNSFAFEIWSYYHFPATSQTNVYFVFYEKDLVTKDFRLLHSNATGELHNPQWKRILRLEVDIPMPDDDQMQREDYNRRDWNETDEYVY